MCQSRILGRRHFVVELESKQLVARDQQTGAVKVAHRRAG